MNKKHLLVAVCIFILVIQACSNPSPTPISEPTKTATPPATSTSTPTPTITPTSTPTPIPLAWTQISDWQGIARDTTTAIAIDPKDPNVLYVGTEHAGIYISSDGGQSWVAASKGLEAAHVTSLLIDKLDSKILYAGIGDLGLFTSTDGGENWIKTRENTSSDLPVYVYQSPGNSNIYYYREGHSIYYKNNNKEWTKLSMPSCFGTVNESAFAIHPQNDQVLFSTCKNGLYKSENSGTSWELSVDWNARNQSTDITGDTQVLATSLLVEVLPDGKEAFYLSSDIRDDDMSAGWIGDPYWWSVASWCTDSIALNPKGGGYVFCNNEIFSFASVGTSKRALTNPNIGPIETIMVPPHDANIIYAGGNGLARSADGGKTWTTLNNGLGAEFARLIKPDLDANIFYLWTGNVCNYKMADYNTGAYRSLDRGQTWESFDRTGCSFAVSADGRTVFMAGEFHPNSEGYYIQGTHIWVSAEPFNEQIFRSNDYGKSWTALPQKGNIFANPVINGRIYSFSIDDKAKISKSDDNGNTWQSMNPGDLKTWDGIELYFSNNGNQIYAYTNGDVYQSANSGARWNWFAGGILSEMVIHPQNAEKTFLTILDGNLQYLNLSGKPKPTDTPRFASPVINTLALDPNHPDTVYAGTDSGAYISFDFGQTWNQINDGLPDTTVVYSIAVDSESNAYAATPYGVFKLEGR